MESEMEKLRQDVTDTRKLVYKIARSLENIENVILPTEYNNNRGILQVVGELEAKVEGLQKFKDNTELLQQQEDKRRERKYRATEIFLAALVIIQIGLEVYKNTK